MNKNHKMGSKSTNMSKLAEGFDGSAKFENGFVGSAIIRTYKYHILYIPHYFIYNSLYIL